MLKACTTDKDEQDGASAVRRRPKKPQRSGAERRVGGEHLRNRKVERTRDLHRPLASTHEHHGDASAFDEGGVVGGGTRLGFASLSKILMRPNNRLKMKTLRGLHGAQQGAVVGFDNTLQIGVCLALGDALDSFDRVRHLKRGNDGRMPRGQRIDDAPDYRAGHEWARGVVDENAIGILCRSEGFEHMAKSESDGFLACSSTADDVSLRPRSRPLSGGSKDCIEDVDPIGRSHDNDSINHWRGGHRANGMDKQRLAGEQLKSFGPLRTEPRPLSCGDYHRGNTH